MLMLNEITVKDYKNSCIKFAKDSIDWVDSYIESSANHFTTTDGGDWDETCDNAHGGFDIRWAFHLSEKEVEERYMGEYLNCLKKDVEWVVDSECVTEDWNIKEIQQYLEWILNALS